MSLMNRRRFLKCVGAGVAGSSLLPTALWAGSPDPEVTILFTNDLHSRVDPRPAVARTDPLHGGLDQLARMVDRFRQQSREIVLLDAGDVLDARSEWVERWQGDVEYRWIQETGYDAVALGDQELRLGVEALARLGREWSPPWIASNYRVTGTLLEDYVEPYRIVERGGIRIGVFSLGIAFSGRVPERLTEGLAYGDPILWAGQMVRYLRQRRLCDYCICLSHLGYQNSEGVDDVEVARATTGLDLIIGGHSHTLLEEPVRIARTDGSETWIVQSGSGGLRLGRVDLCRTGYGENQRVISCVQP